MESSIAARQRGEARMWRAVLRLVDSELAAAFAHHDRRAVRRLGAEAQGLRSLGAAAVARAPKSARRRGPGSCSDSRGA